MLHAFISANAEELARQCRALAASCAGMDSAPRVTERGIPPLIEQAVVSTSARPWAIAVRP